MDNYCGNNETSGAESYLSPEGLIGYGFSF